MPKTLLAVDDSATMRKVLEITFSGEDFNVITAEGHQAAIAKLSEQPRVCVIDTTLGSEDGYALCKEIRGKDGSVALILLTSRYTPYDQAKGKEAGADDYMDKPFDTQQMIDKVRKVLLTKEGAGAGTSPGIQPAAAAPAARPAAPDVPPIQQRGTQPSLGGQAPAAAPSRPRAATLMFDTMPKSEAKGDAPALASQTRNNTPAAVTPVTSGPVSAVPATTAATPAALHAAHAAVNGHLSGKIGELGLSPAQAEAVLALSREVIERVVWEVVPQLAETMIREEIARLIKEG